MNGPSVIPRWRAGRLLVTVCVCVLASSCGNRARKAETAIEKRNVQLVARRWSGDGAVWFNRLDRFGSGDAFRVTCDSAGIYEFTDAHVRPVVTGRKICDILLVSDEMSWNTAGDEAVYARDGWAGLVFFRLEGQALDSVALPCAAVSTPAWSPDARRIAFTGACRGSQRRSVYLVSRDGSQLRAVDEPPAGTFENYPSWSPDGRAVVVGTQIGPPSQVVVVDTASGRRSTIADGFAPAWAPAGDYVAYVHADSSGGRQTSIRVASSGGGPSRLVVTGSSSELKARGGAWTTSAPVWSPNGRTLAFTNARGLWVVNLDGSQLRGLVLTAAGPSQK